MEQHKLGEMEEKFANLIWDNEPIGSRTLTELCNKEFKWKRTTTYTMLKRLCARNIFQNNNAIVTSLISKSDFKALQGEHFIAEVYNGSLPQFLTAFTRRKKLSKKEINEIQNLIDTYKE